MKNHFLCKGIIQYISNIVNPNIRKLVCGMVRLFLFSTRECEKYAYTSHARMLTQSEVIMHIQSLYDVGEMQATQYDDLMRYIQDM